MKEHYTKGKFKDSLFLSELFLERIVNKLTLCVYAIATIVPLVTDMTGLDNYLRAQSIFNRSISDMMINFLSCLPPPVCLEGHNGNAYDFERSR